MRICLVVLLLAVHLANAGFFDQVSSLLSGAKDSSTVSPNNILSSLENSSLGQAVASGISNYQNTSTDLGQNLLSSVQNSSFGHAALSTLNQLSNNASAIGNDILSNLQNSSIAVGITNLINGNTTVDFGNFSFNEAVLNGLSYLRGNSSETTVLISSYVPFLANATANATQSFSTLLPTLSNMTIAQFETAVDSWAAEWNLTSAVNAFNTRVDNITLETEQNAAKVVMSLDLVLTNLKSIRNNTDQTFAQMYNATLTYLNTLDTDTRAIVFILYRPVLPPQLQMIESCTATGISDIIQNAGNLISGVFGANSSSSSSSTGTFAGVNSVLFQNFFNRNNATNENFSASVSQVLSRVQDTSIDETTTTTEETKQKKKRTTTKKHKKTTTVAPE